MSTPTLPQLFDRLASALEPELRAAVLAAFAGLGDAVDEAHLRHAIEQAGTDRARLDAVLRVLLDDPTLATALAPVRDALRAATAAGGQVLAESIGTLLTTHPDPAAPSAPTPDATTGTPGTTPGIGDTIRVTFQVVHPRVVETMRAAELELFPQLAADVRAGARQLITDALAEGRGPAEAARAVRPLLGLTESQAASVARQRQRLTSGTPGEVRKFLGLANRDARHDRTVRTLLGGEGATLTPAQVDRVVSAYGRRLLAQSAETLARTESLNALRRANRAAWDQATEQLGYAPEDIIREWRARLDGRERPAHHAMHGQIVPLGEDWQVPGVGPQPYPGASEYGCRCFERIVPRWIYELGARVQAA